MNSDDPSIPSSILTTADPGLPRPNPTQSYWQHRPHPLANVQSAPLPSTTDIAVIGSGITGLSVAKNLLEQHPTAVVTVLEARTLCSGATGRNGGQLAPNAAEEYLTLLRAHGAEMAGRIVRFTLKNLDMMMRLIEEYAPEEAQLERVRKLRVFLSSKAFAAFKASLAKLERDHPDLKGVYEVVDAERVVEEFGIYGSAGAALLPAGTAWPYRIVTSVFAALREKYPARLAIETNTPVTAVSYDAEPSAYNSPYPYTLHTARGPLRAGKVTYCTNGYTGHLLPKLRGLIYPFKGSMTVQDPGQSVPNRASSISWAFHYPVSYNNENQHCDHGLYYLLQNRQTGYFFFGGESAPWSYSISADDSFMERYAVEHLQRDLPRYFGKAKSGSGPGSDSDWQLVSAWSGIMGFSFDELPLVGKLPRSLTNRGGDGEWIAAAFNGYGMANCLLSGEALVKMMLGEDVSACFPGAYFIDEPRLMRAKLALPKL